MIFKLILRELFGAPERHNSPSCRQELPKNGEVWIRSIYDESPWPKRTLYEVKIIDVKNGWVRYYLGEFFPDERMKIDIFTSIYSKKN
jgi:hypothetical protein